MKRILLALTISTAPACAAGASEPGPRTVQPGAPGEASREVEAARPGRAEHPYTAADVGFLRAMIPHHAQALAMTALAPDRAAREDIRLLAERIDASQRTEIAQMRRWLESRGEPAPATGWEQHAGHVMAAAAAGDPGGAHGMATPEELARLEAARGAAFDRLFLTLMIRHHEGALTMTRELLASEGAGQEPELFQLLSHIDADQRAEIARMRRILDAPQP